jgi:hypothetical protein
MERSTGHSGRERWLGRNTERIVHNIGQATGVYEALEPATWAVLVMEHR